MRHRSTVCGLLICGSLAICSGVQAAEESYLPKRTLFPDAVAQDQSGSETSSGQLALGPSQTFGAAASSIAKSAIAAPPAPNAKYNVHFLLDVGVYSQYFTPRGLVVHNEGASTHFLLLALVDLYKNDEGPLNAINFAGGFWLNLQAGKNLTTFDEIDPILSFDFVMWKKWTFGATYVPFDVTNVGVEHNIEFKIAYDDTELLGDWALHPYVKPFWHFSGPSPVVLGKSNAWDFEFGISPGFTLMKDTDTPVSISFPVTAVLGNATWYGGASGGDLGLVTVGINASIPLNKIIPSTSAMWTLYAGFQYAHIYNDALLAAGGITSGNTNRDIYTANIGFKLFIP